MTDFFLQENTTKVWWMISDHTENEVKHLHRSEWEVVEIEGGYMEVAER